MSFIVVTFILIFTLIHNSVEINNATNTINLLEDISNINEHGDYSFTNELEHLLWTNLTWLTSDQMEVLQDLKSDGYNISELQKEVIIFYNITTGFARRNAYYHIMQGCSNLLNNFTTDERFEEIGKNINTDNASNVEMYLAEYEMLLHQESNETEIVKLFTNGCFPIYLYESEEFLTQFDEWEKNEKQIQRFDRIIVEHPKIAVSYKFDKAQTLIKLLEAEAATKIFDEIIALEPNSTSYLEEYADVLTSLKRYEESTELYDRILKFEPNDIKIYDKKLNALIKHADQSYDKANEIILDKYFKFHWMNDTQKLQIRCLKAEGKKASEIFDKYFEFFENLDEKKKVEILHSIEEGCIHVLYTVFGHEKAEEVLALKDNSSDIFEKQFKDIFNNSMEEGLKRIATTYMPQCRKIFTFNEEMIPRIMISPKIDGKIFEFIFDTGADVTMANKEVWEAIGKPYLHSCSKSIHGVGGNKKPLGRCRVTVEIDGKSAREWLYILEDGMLLFGRKWIKNFNIRIEH